MSVFDPSKTITLDQPALRAPVPLPNNWAQAAFSLSLRAMLFAALLAFALWSAGVLQSRGAHWTQSERNRYVAQMAVQALERTREAAISSGTVAQWTQSAQGRDDAPYVDGSVWTIRVADVAVFGRSEINVNLGVRLHSPQAFVRFDAAGRPFGGATRLTVDSTEPGDAFVIEIGTDGRISKPRAVA